MNGAYLLSNEARYKYSSIFFHAIMDEKESIYQYVRLFYWRCMGNRQEFPYYSLENRACSSSPMT